MKLLPIGISDYKEIIDTNCYYIDKTLLIKELLETSGKVILLPRPRRFGKTLNLSMLKYFFEKTDTDNSYLFKNTEIWKINKFREHLGKYPVIFITFKDVKDETWEKAYKKIIAIIAKEFEYYFEFIKDSLSDVQLKDFNKIRKKNADQAEYETSLLFLSEMLYRHYKTKVIVLIDEYDTPIQAGYNYKFYNQVINFMKFLLSSALKDNINLERGILTGILRTAKEGIFSGLNNLKVCSILDIEFEDKFGFTTNEIEKILKDYSFSNRSKDVQQWYNGYMFGKNIIYNPWSIISFVDKKGDLNTYWSNTSDNDLIKKIIAQSNESVKVKFELLLSDQSVIEEVIEAIIYPEIEKNDQAIWSLLLFAGYLTCKNLNKSEEKKICGLVIPNLEIKKLFTKLINEIFNQSLDVSKTKLLLQSLITANIDTFSELLQEFIINSMSNFDLNKKNEPEKSYHLFVLGLLVMLSDKYQVKSNRESGLGRYDIMLIPKDKQNLGIIIEFKKVSIYKNETLKTAAQNALDQIQERKYAQEFKDNGIKKIKTIGIAFKGKEILILAQDLS